MRRVLYCTTCSEGVVTDWPDGNLLARKVIIPRRFMEAHEGHDLRLVLEEESSLHAQGHWRTYYGMRTEDEFAEV